MSGIILASASPRRRDLLRDAAITFRAAPSSVAEVTPRFLSPAETALLNAKRKAGDVAQRHPRSLVVGADTIVALGTKLLGKPRTIPEARRMLQALSGRAHDVVSGVWICRGRRQAGFIERSRVSFRKLHHEEIRRYVTLINPLDKAGGYAAQEDPLGIIARIEGSRTNVIGLPMERLREVLGLTF